MINELNIEYNKLYSGTAEGKEKHLVFILNGNYYAIKANDVAEIIGEIKVTFVPMLPAHISGIINLRGVLVPIIDLSILLNGTKSEKYSIIILKNANEQIGLLVEKVDQMIDIDTTTINKPETKNQLDIANLITGTSLSPAKESTITVLNSQVFFKDIQI